MERNSDSHPSFIKLLIEDDFTREIRIPHAFARDFKEKLSSKCTIISVAKKSGQKSWPARIRKKGRYNYICRRSWPKFVKDHHLKLGDYLVFRLINKTTFTVTQYGPDCCPKKPKVYKSSSSSTDDDDDDDSSDDDDDSSDEIKFSDDDDINLSKGHHARTKNYGKRPDLRSNKSRKLRKSRNSGFGKKVHGSESEEEEREEANERDGHFDLNTENPYFIVTLKKHHKNNLNIPKPFARGTDLEMEKEVALRGEDNREWLAQIIKRSYGRIDIAKGWSDFRNAYNLVEGETCRFTLLKRYGNLIHIQISRT